MLTWEVGVHQQQEQELCNSEVRGESLGVSLLLLVLVWSPLLGGREEDRQELAGVPVQSEGLAAGGQGEGNQGAACHGPA